MPSSPAHATDASSKPRPKLLAALRKTTLDSSESGSESDNGASASEDERPVPTVKPHTTPPPQSDTEESKEDAESDGEDAYELMKKRLAANKARTTQEPSQQAHQEAPIVATIESCKDKDEIPIRANVRESIARRPKTASPRTSPSPSVRSRRSSPGLFVTPDPSPARKQSRKSAGAGSESDDSSRPTHNANLEERVRRIREERLAKQQEEEAQRTKPKKIARRRADQASGSDTDGESGRKLTQQAKPTRRAGKKAMEVIARDQQRISRNMQLTHQAKTKKRFTTQDLFKKFNYQAPGAEVAALPTPDSGLALVSSDAEANQIHDTPPTSPPRQEEALVKQNMPTELETPTAVADKQDDMETPRPARVDKGKGRVPEFQHLPVHPWTKEAEPVPVHNAVVDAKKPFDDAMVELSDSDDDLQVQPKSRFPVFDRLPAKKQHQEGSLVRLRALAQLAKSPQKVRKGQKSVTLGEMEFMLAQKARQQTLKAKEERIADLIKRGHNPDTEEENEKRQAEIDDMVALFEKQRQEDLKLAKMERKEAKANGETIDDLPSSDEEDGDYVGSSEEDANQGDVDLEAEAEVELSGSEDEEMEDGEDEEAGNSNGLIDELADEDEEPQEETLAEQVDEDADMEDDIVAPVRKPMVRRARNRVIDDDDESDAEAPKPVFSTQQATEDNAAAAFGFGNAGPGLGLTQMFAGTMAELEAGSQPAAAVEIEQNSLDFLRSLPETQPGAHFSQASDFVVPSSQSLMSPQKESQTGVDSQFCLGISQLIKDSPAFLRTQIEDFEPTQDAGFSFSRSPAGLAPPPSTVDTVMMAVAESPIKQKKSKLRRGREEAAVELSDVEEDLVDADEEMSEDDIQLPPKPGKNTFQKMQQAAKKARAVEEFNKKKSMAREAFMEQAEESEDEYAGLGGASDDEEGEEDEDLKDMIDHSNVKVDERQIAALYADKAKEDDEKRLVELYKKLQKRGGLRRGAGGYDGFDMSDSEDEVEMRQRKKRAAFQKQTNALLQDQKVKALAEDDKKKAFFNTLADFADEGDYDYLVMPSQAVEEEEEDSQSQEQSGQQEGDNIAIPDSQDDSQSMLAPLNPLKRKSPDTVSRKENRPPPNERRTKASDAHFFRRPMNKEETESMINELIEDPRGVIVPDSQLSDGEGEADLARMTSRKPIVDRLSLSRQSSLSASSSQEHLAFHAPSNNSVPGFRVPSLIRQATSNLSISSERSTSNANTGKESGVRRGGTGRSNIHAQAREAERRALLEKKEGKRKEALRKQVVGMKKGRSALQDLGGGFE